MFLSPLVISLTCFAGDCLPPSLADDDVITAGPRLGCRSQMQYANVFLQIVNIYIYVDFMCAISTSEKGGHQAAAAAENMDLLMVP